MIIGHVWVKSTATATAAFLPLGTGPAWCGSVTMATVIQVGTQWTVSSADIMWPPG